MTGINDRHNFHDSNYYLFQKGITARLAQIEATLIKFRLYKLMRYVNAEVPAHNRGNGCVKKDNAVNVSEQMRLDVIEADKRYLEYIAAGKEYHAQIKIHEAIEEFKKAILADPNRVEAHYELAYVYLHRTGQLEKAIEEFEKVLAIDPANVNAMRELGDAFLRSGDKDSLMVVMKKLKEAYSGSDDRESLFRIMKYGIHEIHGNRMLIKLLKYNINIMKKIADNANVRLIIMNYPTAIFSEHYDDTIRMYAFKRGLTIRPNSQG